MTSQIGIRRLGAPSILTLALMIAACSSPPPPTAELRAASDSIARAKYDAADQLAPQQIQMAEGKYAQAQADVKAKKMDEAKWMAEQADVDAQYAQAVANEQRVAGTAQQLGGAEMRQDRGQPINK